MSPRGVAALGLVTALAACSPTRWARGRYEKRFEAAGLTEGAVSTACCIVHTWAGGAGSPVMLLQGFGGDALVQWDRQVGPLAQHHRLLVPDLVFFGGSTSSDPRRSLALQAEAMFGVADAHGIDRFDVVGVSYGGLVGWWMAVQAPERVRRLVLIDSPGVAFGPTDLDAMLTRHGVSSTAELLLPTGPDGVSRLLGLVEPTPRLPDLILRDIHRQMFTDQVAEKQALLDDLTQTVGRAGALPVPQQPTLLVWGAGDPVFPVEIAHRLQARLPGPVQLVVIEGALHGPNVSHPDEVNAALLPFLRAPQQP